MTAKPTPAHSRLVLTSLPGFYRPSADVEYKLAVTTGFIMGALNPADTLPPPLVVGGGRVAAAMLDVFVSAASSSLCYSGADIRRAALAHWDYVRGRIVSVALDVLVEATEQASDALTVAVLEARAAIRAAGTEGQDGGVAAALARVDRILRDVDPHAEFPVSVTI